MLELSYRRGGVLGTFVDWNIAASARLDRLFNAGRWRTCAVGDFKRRAPTELREGQHIWDVAAARSSNLRPSARNLTITGLDVDPAELALMQPGACDRVVTADLCRFRGDGSADLVIGKTVLEHVPDVDQAFANLVSMMQPGGTLALCVPCRNAWFARLNLLLPEGLKRRLLHGIFPHSDDGHGGFPAKYDRCTPSYFRGLAATHELEVRELRAHWCSNYFVFFLPLWLTWRLWQIAARTIVGEDACEGFVMVAKRPAGKATRDDHHA